LFVKYFAGRFARWNEKERVKGDDSMVNEKINEEVNEEKPEKDVALEVNLSLAEFSEEKRVSGIVALFTNCDYMLSENQKGFRTKEEYLAYLAGCGNAMIVRDKKDGG
jgi:hypothetical protein